MDAFFQNFQLFLQRLNPRQRIALGGVVLGSITLFIGIAYWAGKPDYALLFAGLGPSDADQIVESLKSENVQYQLREGGSAIFVPRDKVYDLRLRLAGEGKISDGLSGYELFNQNTLGMTDFMQKLNFKRALEGELARTITNIRQVEMCRVHLVIPERSPFREAQNRPSASVVLRLRGGPLSPAQIEGITSLVAGAVEGLAPSEVTILDNRGNLLSDPSSGDIGFQTSNAQIRMQREVESHLVEKGQSMLDQVLGPRNAVIRVSASLDFSRAVTEREMVDPESATVISEERLEEEVESGNANSLVRNYELSRSRERSEKNVGDVSYLTVSVIVNSRRTGDAEMQQVGDNGLQEATYSEADLEEIEALVKNAVGFNPERGDRFVIHQTRFDTSMDHQVISELQAHYRREQMHTYIRYGILVLGIAMAFWLLRSVYNRISEEQPGLIDGGLLSQMRPDTAMLPPENNGSQPLRPQSGLTPLEHRYLSKLSPEARQSLLEREETLEQVAAAVSESPESAAGLVRSWLQEQQTQQA